MAVVVAIYSTLGLAGIFAETLRDRKLLDQTFVVAFLVLVAALAAIGLQRRATGIEIAAGLGVVAVYGMMIMRMGLAERTHLFEYTLVSVLLRQALMERKRNGGKVKSPALVAIAGTILLGWLDEWIQALLPNRVYDNIDVLFNAFAGSMAIGASLVLEWARRRGARWRG